LLNELQPGAAMQASNITAVSVLNCSSMPWFGAGLVQFSTDFAKHALSNSRFRH
jgi:hypothetical protein